MSKGRIDEDGFFEIFRGYEFVRVACDTHPDPMYCGDWCVKFREPEYRFDFVDIRICDGEIWRFKTGDFEDLRAPKYNSDETLQ